MNGNPSLVSSQNRPPAVSMSAPAGIGLFGSSRLQFLITVRSCVHPPIRRPFAEPCLAAHLDAVVGLRPGVIDSVDVEDVDQPLLCAIQAAHGQRGSPPSGLAIVTGV